MHQVKEILAPSSQPQTADKLPQRHEISAKYKWHLEDIYPSDKEWENDYARLEQRLSELDAFQGHLAESPEKLAACLALRDTLEETLSKLYLYAGLKSDEDSRVTKYQAFRDRATRLNMLLNQRTAYIQPEILDIPEETLRQWVKQESRLAIYAHYLDDLLRMKPHVLPHEQEKLLAMTGEIAQGPYTIFSMFNNADLRFPSIKDERGREVEVTKGRFLRFMESPDRRVRRDAFAAMYRTYGNWKNTLSATLSTSIKRDIFYANARKYPNALSAALDADNVPVSLYDNVVGTINENLQPLHRYTELRRRMLKLEQVEPWDLFVPLVPEMKLEIPYEEAQGIIVEALAPLGEEYGALLKQGFENGWIDVFENQGKRSGAYSWSTYGVHPYVLLNYNNTLNDLLTVAHELGHALHSYYTNQHQPYIYSHYTIFVAEVASTLNETLLIDYLIKNAAEAQKKLYLLNEYADRIRGTVYIQTLFAEFERAIHERAEAGEALTVDLLNQLTRELYTRYFGSAFSMDELYQFNWSRIPHFYYNFYVYKYVTGFSAATALAREIIAGDVAARDRYLHFLTRGNSDYSITLLRDAGVDMTTPEPIRATAEMLKEIVSQMESF